MILKYNFIDDITTKSFNSIFCNSIHKNFKDIWISPIRIYMRERVCEYAIWSQIRHFYPNLTDLTAIRHIESELIQNIERD